MRQRNSCYSSHIINVYCVHSNAGCTLHTYLYQGSHTIVHNCGMVYIKKIHLTIIQQYFIDQANIRVVQEFKSIIAGYKAGTHRKDPVGMYMYSLVYHPSDKRVLKNHLLLAEKPVKGRRGIFARIKIFWNNVHFSPNCRNFVIVIAGLHHC